MNLPLLREKLPDVLAWIDRTLGANAARAGRVAARDFPRLGAYYSRELLASVAVIPTTRVPVPPLGRLGVAGFEEFEELDAAGITYRSSFFVRHGYERDESLHFHELVHVVQWQHLGPEGFILAYALGYLAGGGYRANPLETMAYDLQAEFDRRAPAFDVAPIVVAELDRVVPALLRRAAGPDA